MIYAKTTNPEHIDYDMYFETFLDGTEENEFIFYGNKDYRSTNKEIIDDILNIANDWDYVYYDYDLHKRETVEYRLGNKSNGKAYSPKEIAIIFKEYSRKDFRNTSDYEENLILTCLKIKYGKTYKQVCLRGYSQGDWQYMYCPADTKEDIIDYIEKIYFGGGTEVMIHDEENEVNDASDIYGWTFYTSEYDEEELIKEIQEQVGTNEEVTLYMFDGYIHTPKYNKVISK